MKKLLVIALTVACLSPGTATAAPFSTHEAIRAMDRGLTKVFGSRFSDNRGVGVGCAKREEPNVRRCGVEWHTRGKRYHGHLRIDRNRRDYAIGGVISQGGQHHQVETTVRRAHWT
ncbi:hypothetical protein HJD18_03405 [Thermoleophilia bacterium SCSIO 60948]|nr:hypothetical protein HJD18_03405 [Thermoleophilia bacterium SCSIO 60948]